jgi:Flp pilus assembly protein TadB
MRMDQSVDQFELAFEQESALERRRRQQLRQRAAQRSRARHIQTTEKHGTISFGVLLIALTLTVVVVTVVMFETLAWLMA